ncbi:MAG TPA: HIT family protein [Bacteroidales bacterium]|nr:HIT family protein [Bacteroidales bacterium]HOH22309.1 HIT family protein [Bacteroidales bacterium]HPB57141.1 HIT family protein [Bacteroidales bacterium]HPZ03242.1 HIT family protein [Bacteroidales bacterium]HQB74625.1 HIT family protein [Bacteroidales bacterium]
MTETLFTKIINGEIPSYKVAEDDQFYAFLDISPLAVGHTLVVPKKPVDYIFDLEDKVLADLMVYAKKIAKAIESVVPCARIGVAVIGLEVPHTHIHLVPINDVGDIDFKKPRVELSHEEMSQVAKEIADNIK